VKNGSPSECVTVLAGRAEDTHLGQPAHCHDRPQLRPRLGAAATDPNARGLAEVGAESRWRSEDAAVSIDQGTARGGDCFGGVEPRLAAIPR
jgi:hypothetical protein